MQVEDKFGDYWIKTHNLDSSNCHITMEGIG